MKRFILGFSKLLPWIALIVGIISIIANPPKNSSGYDEDGAMIVFLFILVILSSLFLQAFAYIVEASIKYLENTKDKQE